MKHNPISVFFTKAGTCPNNMSSNQSWKKNGCHALFHLSFEPMFRFLLISFQIKYRKCCFKTKTAQLLHPCEIQITKNGFIFIKQVRHHLIHTFLHCNRAKTAGIFFTDACFNQFQNICKEPMLPELMAVLRSFNEVNKRLSTEG